MTNVTRRRFLEDYLLAAAAAATPPLPTYGPTASLPASVIAAEQRSVRANDKITVAIIGCGIRGKQHAGELARLSDCEIAYVCDPDHDRATELASDIASKGGRPPKAVQD